MEMELAERIQPIDLIIPYDKGKLLGELHDSCKVLEQSYEEDGIHIRAVLSQEIAKSIRGKLEK